MSKTILIIGDSWGTPNYDTYHFPNTLPSDHTEFKLRSLGYKVYNCSLNGGSNTKTIELAKSFLQGEEVTLEPKYYYDSEKQDPTNRLDKIDIINPKIDWVIWFHTEFFRSRFKSLISNKLDDDIRIAADKEYAFASEFFKTQNAKIAIIGGQCPVIIDLLYRYINPDFLIEDWRSDLIGYKLPPVYTLAKTQWVEESTDTIDYKNELLSKHKVILDAMEKNVHFFDGCHPGATAHQLLTEQLNEVIQNE